MTEQESASEPKRVEIMWVELILIALLVLGVMGVWLVAEPFVTVSMQAQAPSEALSQQEADVPARQAQVALAKDGLTQLQAALVKERMSIAVQTAQMAMLAAQNPQLNALVAPPGNIPLDPATMQSFLAAQTKLSAATTLGRDLEKRLDELINASVTLTASLNSLPESSLQWITAHAHLDLAEQELDRVQAQIVDQRLEVMRQQAFIQTLQENYPQLLAIKKSKDDKDISMSLMGTSYQYLELVAQNIQSREMVTALEGQQDLAMRQLEEQNTELLQAQAQAKQKLEQAKENYRIVVRGAALLVASILSLTGLLVVGIFLAFTKKLHTYPLRPLVIVLITLALTAVLYSYQAFEYLGGAIAGILLLTAGLLWLSRQKRKAGAPAAKVKA